LQNENLRNLLILFEYMPENPICFDSAEILPRQFYLQPTAEVARDLIGKIFVKQTHGQTLAAKITETEAYLSENDPASHSATGPTPRNKAMFGQPGTLYVYKIYGIHRCINFVCGLSGTGTAVLIRASEPMKGIDIMKRNRGTDDVMKLCKGPGNLAKAFGIDTDMNFARLDTEEICVLDSEKIPAGDIVNTPRIGITKATGLLLRFYLRGSKYISGKR
jgi:DNA-3-methyladenine glycosylase